MKAKPPEFNLDLMKYSIDFKIMLMRKAIIELKARESNKYYAYDATRPNTNKYVDFHRCDKKIRICKGAPRTGKTMACIHEIAMHVLDEHPFFKLKREPKIVWIVATSFKKVRDVLMPMFKENIPMNRVFKVQEDRKGNDYYIEFDNRRKIVFKSQEEGMGGFTSAEVNIILMDERVENEDIRMQLRTRVISTDGMLIFTMDSFEPDEWIEDLSRQTYAKVFEFELKDNMKYLPMEELDRLEEELGDIDRERLIHGKYKARNRSNVFGTEIFTKNNLELLTPSRWTVHNNELYQEEMGYLRIYKQPTSEVKYIAGLDTASGSGGNSHALQVFDEFGEQVAVLLDNKVHYVLLPDVIIAILRFYNDALLVPENRAQGIYVANKISESYYNIYIDGVYNYDPKRPKKPDYGILTNERNKIEMIDKTLSDITDCKLLLHDEYTMIQLQNFVKDEEDRGTQKKGAKYHGTRTFGNLELKNSDDDLVMALLFTDKALNVWGYLNNVNRKKIFLDQSKRQMEKINSKTIWNPMDNVAENGWWAL